MKKLVLAAMLSSSLLLTGCAADTSEHDHIHSSAMATNDEMFVSMMVPHHEQALEMVALAEKNTSTTAILKLAEGIKNAQTAEVAAFKTWLTEHKVTGEPMAMDHGILSESQMAELESANDGAFDQLFLKYMIGHHQGAVDMSTPYFESADPQVAKWAKGIFVSQQSEILVMQALLRKM